MSRVTHIRRTSRRVVHITERDQRLLRALVDRRVETLDDYLWPKVFDGASRKRAMNRLGELISAGYVSRTSLTLSDGEQPRSVYMITPRGHTALERRSPAGTEYMERRRMKDVPLASIPHEYWTNRVRDWLGGVPIAPHQVRGDLFRKLESHHRPDLIYQGREQDREGRDLVWVEVDTGHYSNRRIAEKVRAFLHEGLYRDENPTAFLLFVCETDARREHLRTAIGSAAGGYSWHYMDAMTFADLRAGVKPGYLDAVHGEEFPDFRPHEGQWRLEQL